MFCLRLDEASLFGAFGPGGIAQILFTDGAIFAASAVGGIENGVFDVAAGELERLGELGIIDLAFDRRTWRHE